MLTGIFRGEHVVAVKQLHADLNGEPMSAKAKQEFMEEAKILKTLQHPHLVMMPTNVKPCSYRFFVAIPK